MKALNTEEIRALTTEELVRRENEYRESLFKMRMKLATGQLAQVSEVKVTRRNVARVLTEMNRRAGK
jgi:large subunit ribosomal protein L29